MGQPPRPVRVRRATQPLGELLPTGPEPRPDPLESQRTQPWTRRPSSASPVPDVPDADPAAPAAPDPLDPPLSIEHLNRALAAETGSAAAALEQLLRGALEDQAQPGAEAARQIRQAARALRDRVQLLVEVLDA